MPIPTKKAPAPNELIKTFPCGCKTGCKSTRYTCRKHGLKCNQVCKECRRVSCTNSQEVIEENNWKVLSLDHLFLSFIFYEDMIIHQTFTLFHFFLPLPQNLILTCIAVSTGIKKQTHRHTKGIPKAYQKAYNKYQKSPQNFPNILPNRYFFEFIFPWCD